MSVVKPPRVAQEVEYPSSDGRPMGETPYHVKNLLNLVFMLDFWFAGEQFVYVAGNMFVYYVAGDRHKHLSPDVFVVKGIPKKTTPERRCYLVWEEHKAPDLAIELTSASTRDEDLDDKFHLYRDILKVREYFLFDPWNEYLDPPLQGYRLVNGEYEPITPVNGRLPSEVLGLHLERNDWQLRLYSPATGNWLPAIWEMKKISEWAEIERQRAESERQQVEEENQRLRRQLDALRQKLGEQP
jgi:Uma2 family endonuclease